jgi:ribosome-associated translation inhibitor RaiA
MKSPYEARDLRIELDTKNCTLSPAELERMEREIDPLREPVHDFPTVVLYISVIHHARSGDYHVRVSLVLPGRTLFTGARDEVALAAFGRCAGKLVRKVVAYKARLGTEAERAKAEKGTEQIVVPTRQPDLDALRQAVQSGDYPAFRQSAFVYEEPIRKRVGRWIERYPDFEVHLGSTFTIADIVEEVFLNAFDRFDERPRAVPLGKWLEQLIDPSMKAIWRDPDAEHENIEAVRTWQERAEGAP